MKFEKSFGGGIYPFKDIHSWEELRILERNFNIQEQVL